MKRILCVATTGMGNVLLYLPVIHTLRKRYPDAVIDLLLSNAPAQKLLEGMPEVNRIIHYQKRPWSMTAIVSLLRTLKERDYNLFITSYLDKSFKVALLGVVLNIPIRVGFKYRFWGLLFTHRVIEGKRKHEVEYNLDLLRAIGITDLQIDISLPITNDVVVQAKKRIGKTPGRLRIGFHPGSGTDLGLSVKRWEIRKFTLLADMLSERIQADVIIFGGSNERMLVSTMAASMRAPSHVFVNEEINMTAALIAQCDLFVSNDSGLMHLASTMKVPVVGVFGPTLWWKNYPWQVPHVVVCSHLHCAPCYHLSGISCRKQRCLAEITVDEVYSRTVELLGKLARASGEILLKQDRYNNVNRNLRFKHVSIITPDFSHNCVGRAFMLAQLISSQAIVEIVGPAFKGSVWAPIERVPEGVTYTYSKCSKIRYFLSTAFRLARMIDGDVIIISKPVLPSMVLAMLALLRRRTPLIIDIDDWEIGFEIDRFNNGGLLQKVVSLGQISKLVMCEIFARFIKNRIVSNTYLQRSFGGLLVPHVRDTRIFNPSTYDKELFRRKYGIASGMKVILFLGTPREHKGLNELMSAFVKVNIRQKLLVLVGFNLLDGSQRELHDRIKVQLGEGCLLFGQQPFDRIPGFLAMADVVVIPQQNTPSSKGQIPAKLFDAMAMGKPIIASKVNDIPVILAECGLTYDAGNVDELSRLLEKVLGDDHLAHTMGERARQLCLEKYSYVAVRDEVFRLIDCVFLAND